MNRHVNSRAHVKRLDFADARRRLQGPRHGVPTRYAPAAPAAGRSPTCSSPPACVRMQRRRVSGLAGRLEGTRADVQGDSRQVHAASLKRRARDHDVQPPWERKAPRSRQRLSGSPSVRRPVGAADIRWKRHSRAGQVGRRVTSNSSRRRHPREPATLACAASRPSSCPARAIGWRAIGHARSP